MTRTRPIRTAPSAEKATPQPTPKSDVQDLTELFENETAIIHLYDPRDEFAPVKRDTGFRVEIGPLWSPEARKIAEENRPRFTLLPSGSVDENDPVFLDTLREQIIAVTKRWWQEPKSPDGINWHGQVVQYTPELGREVYTHPKLGWFYEQVKDGYLDRRRFFGQRSKTA